MRQTNGWTESQSRHISAVRQGRCSRAGAARGCRIETSARLTVKYTLQDLAALVKMMDPLMKSPAPVLAAFTATCRQQEGRKSQ